MSIIDIMFMCLTFFLMIIFTLAGDVKVVGIFRSEESVKKVSERLGNPAEDKFVSVVGNVGE